MIYNNRTHRRVHADTHTHVLPRSPAVPAYFQPPAVGLTCSLHLIAVTKRLVPLGWCVNATRPLSIGARAVHTSYYYTATQYGTRRKSPRELISPRSATINCTAREMCVAVGEENRTRHHRPRGADDERIRGRGGRDRAGKVFLFPSTTGIGIRGFAATIRDRPFAQAANRKCRRGL